MSVNGKTPLLLYSDLDQIDKLEAILTTEFSTQILQNEQQLSSSLLGFEELSEKPSSIILVLCDAKESVIKHLHLKLDLLHTINCYPVLLSSTPSYQQGLQALQSGFKGYGNIHSHPERLRAAFNLIQQGEIWLGATLMNELTQQVQLNQSVLVSSLCDALTQREQGVAQLVITAVSNKEIADTLEISERTVKAHLSSIYEKLGVKNRIELMLLNSQSS